MNSSIELLQVTERKKVVAKRIAKLESFIHEDDTPNLAKKEFEINLKHIREEYRKLEIKEQSLKLRGGE